MNQPYRATRLSLLLCGCLAVLLLALGGCGVGQIAEDEQIVNRATILALTPSPVPPTATPTLTPTPLPPTPTLTPTPLPPTPTTNPAVQGFGFCTEQVGRRDGGRFAARLSDVETTGFPAFEQISLTFEVDEAGAALNAQVQALTERDYLALSGEAVAPAPYVLYITMPNWVQDERLTESLLLNEAATFDNTSVIQSAVLRPTTNRRAGASIAIGLTDPVAYKLDTQRTPARLTLSVARQPDAIPITDDLTTALNNTLPDQPLYFLQDGDIWRDDGGDATNLSLSAEYETSFAVSPDAQTIAFCRTQDADVLPNPQTAPGALWLMDSDGSNQRVLTRPGYNCTNPAFSPDGSLIAFSVDESGVQPPVRSIWVTATNPASPPMEPPDDDSSAPAAPLTEDDSDADNGDNGDPTTDDGGDVPNDTSDTSDTRLALDSPFARVTLRQVEPAQVEREGAIRIAGDATWSRTTPGWLDETTLVYYASSSDGRTTVFTRRLDEQREVNIAADVTQGNDYSRIVDLLPAPPGNNPAVAVTAARADGTGADALLLDRDGAPVDVLSTGYWTRPLAWHPNGDLFTLTTECASSYAQRYELTRREASGDSRLIMAGTTTGALGGFFATSNGLAYITGADAEPGTRATSNIAPQSASRLWYWNLDLGRSVLHEADSPLRGVQAAPGGTAP